MLEIPGILGILSLPNPLGQTPIRVSSVGESSTLYQMLDTHQMPRILQGCQGQKNLEIDHLQSIDTAKRKVQPRPLTHPVVHLR